MAKSGFDAINEFIGKVDSLKDFAKDVAAESRSEIQGVSRATASAGIDPYGTPWRDRKDGTRAIPHAADAIDVVARGTLIVIRIFRGAAIQNFLKPKNRRQVIPDPDRQLPDGIKDAITRSANRVFARKLK
jgi:hypothetical protein